MCVFISCVVSTAVTIGTRAENNSSFKGRTTFLLLVDWWLKLSLYFRIVNYSQVHLSQQLLLQGCSRLASWNRGQRRFTVLDRPLSSGLSAERFCLLQISSRELNESLFVSLRINCALIVLFGCSWMTSRDIFNWKLKTENVFASHCTDGNVEAKSWYRYVLSIPNTTFNTLQKITFVLLTAFPVGEAG